MLNRGEKVCFGIIVGSIIVGFIYIVLVNQKNTESFGDVVGAAGEFRDQYFTCLKKCEKTDPTDRLSQNPWACGMYCDDIVARSVAAGKQLGKLGSVEDVCKKRCKKSSGPLACEAGCVCAWNTAQYCEQQCNHSPLGFPECFSSCVSLVSQNCAGGNSWFWRPT